MSNLISWHKTNNEYLAAAVRWVRLRLIKLSEQQNAVDAQSIRTPASSIIESASRGFAVHRNNKLSETSDEPLAEQLLQGQIEQTATAMAQAEASDQPPALIILAHRLGLTRFEEQILLLCAAMEFDTRVAGLCAQAQNDRNRPNPTFALALALAKANNQGCSRSRDSTRRIKSCGRS